MYQLVPNGPFTKMSVSPNGKLLACFTDTGQSGSGVSEHVYVCVYARGCGWLMRKKTQPHASLVLFFVDDTPACATGVLCVMTSDFSKNLSSFDTKSKVAPDQLVWCGTDSVLLYWDAIKILLMVGPNGDWLKYALAPTPHLFSLSFPPSFRPFPSLLLCSSDDAMQLRLNNAPHLSHFYLHTVALTWSLMFFFCHL